MLRICSAFAPPKWNLYLCCHSEARPNVSLDYEVITP